jgi:hypothetical protein
MVAASTGLKSSFTPSTCQPIKLVLIHYQFDAIHLLMAMGALRPLIPSCYARKPLPCSISGYFEATA